MIHSVIVVKGMVIGVQVPQSAKMAVLASVTMDLHRPNAFVLTDTKERFVRFPQVKQCRKKGLKQLYCGGKRLKFPF